jgi:hypothetical protein
LESEGAIAGQRAYFTARTQGYKGNDQEIYLGASQEQNEQWTGGMGEVQILVRGLMLPFFNLLLN